MHDINNIFNGETLIASFAQNSSPLFADEAWHFSGSVLEIENFELFADTKKSELIDAIKTKYDDQYDSIHIVSCKNSDTEFLESISDHVIHLDKNGSKAFEIKLKDDCPLSAIKMIPCFRYGDMTPWGGDKLKTLFNKEIPDTSTGESMEISTIEGLNSTDPNGETLSELQKKYGKALLGNLFDISEQFPLLIKLLDAKDLLSIQVHPDDSYAFAHENGKLGKEEAWLVLDCAENSKLIYGLKPNTSPEELSRCLKTGESPEEFMNYVYVKKGDVLHIAPGTVHALGTGIVVYEIQQSSDVTYRMWDWARKDKDGNLRELHVEDSINCIKYDNPPKVFSLPSEKGIHTVLDVDSFILYAINLDGEEIIQNNADSFIALTSFANVNIHSYDNILKLSNGDSAIVPANIAEFSIDGKGLILMAIAKKK